VGVLPFLWAAASTPQDAGGWVSYLGPFVPFATLALGIIVYQQRQDKAKDERHAAEMAAKDAIIAEERALNRELSERAVDQAEKVLPVLTEATSVLSEAVRELPRRERR
jgi:hypothetical protein